jgi:hypothetical protein
MTGVTSVTLKDGYSEVTETMQDYYALYTWAMDRQAQYEREAAERRLARHVQYDRPHSNQRRRWPIPGRRDERKAA